MSGKFKNKYRTETSRLKSWNYSWNGAYFVTICTQNRKPFFGEISDQKMIFSDIGKIVNRCWNEIPDHFPFVQLGEFIVMPNHVHGIVLIDKSNDESVEAQHFASQNDDIIKTPREAQGIAPLRNSKQKSQNQFGPQSNNLASIVRGFKIGVTKNARKIRRDFRWQPRFYDHIIRDQGSYQRISEYIQTNPKNWDQDKFYLK